MLVTEQNFQETLDWLSSCELPLTCDTETNYCSLQEDRYLLGIAILGVKDSEEKSFYFPFRHEHQLRMTEEDENLPIGLIDSILRLIEKKKTIWHNGKFDYKQLEQEGLSVNSLFYYDTLTLSHMENENKFSHSLFDLGKLVGEKKLGKELDSIAKKFGDGSLEMGWIQIPPSVMGRYAEEDVKITWQLFKLFFPRVEKDEEDLKREGKSPLYPREVKVSHMLRKLEERGVLIDRELCSQFSERTELRMQVILEQLGFDPMKPSQLAHRLYALPPEGLGFVPEAFSSRPSKEFARGIPIMDEDTLQRIIANSPTGCQEVDLVLEYRGLVKAQSTWYRGWLDKLDSKDRLHPDFKQHGTVTTRFSCANPNLQQLPRDTKNTPVKKLLRASSGFQLWEFDYSQVEFRLGAVYAECQTILDTYREGGDVHKVTAQNVGAYNRFPEDPDKARYVGKQTNFLTIYGGGAGVLQKQLWRDARIVMSEKDCRTILTNFHTAYPEFRRIMKGAENKARSQGFIKFWNGRKRHFNEDYECKKAFNSLVQGGAVQIGIESMLELDKLGKRMVAQVHDSVWIEIPEDNLEAEIEEIKNVMEWPTEKFGIPFPVDCKRLDA